ncbi:LamG domain-containing protein [bacterium]|nr:LamG domain-containing protein [bacterium]
MRVSMVISITIIIMLAVVASSFAALDLGRLLLYWPCDEGKGDKLTDASGNGWDAELVGGKSAWVDGIYDGAINLKLGIGQVEGDIISSTGKTGEITLMCWFRMDAHASYDGLISVEAAAAGCCEYRLMVNPNSNPFWDMGHHQDKSLGNFTFEQKKWYHYALTGDGDKGYVYVDGEFIGDQAENFDLPDFPDVTIYLGTGESPGTHPVEDSTFDDVMIWDKALSEDEINEVMGGSLLSVNSKDKLATTWSRIKAAD